MLPTRVCRNALGATHRGELFPIATMLGWALVWMHCAPRLPTWLTKLISPPTAPLTIPKFVATYPNADVSLMAVAA
jgi:hypothetical protein